MEKFKIDVYADVYLDADGFIEIARYYFSKKYPNLKQEAVERVLSRTRTKIADVYDPCGAMSVIWYDLTNYFSEYLSLDEMTEISEDLFTFAQKIENLKYDIVVDCVDMIEVEISAD